MLQHIEGQLSQHLPALQAVAVGTCRAVQDSGWQETRSCGEPSLWLVTQHSC